jgi:DNA-binding beta-propeller fold protein YncE
MSDRFDFLEIGDEKPKPLPESEVSTGTGLGWKPLRLRCVEQIGEQGTGVGQFSAPTGLAVDPWGAIYVVDSNNHRVQRIAPNGDVVIFGKPGQMQGQMWGPQGIAVDTTGQFFFVAEQGNNRVQCFRFNGQSQGVMSGICRAPSGVAFDVDKMLWIADTGNGRLLRVDTRTGQIIGGLGAAVGIVRPVQVACDHAQNVYVTDGTTHDVTRYTYFGIRAHALGEIRRLNMPMQVAVDREGRVYVAEAGANRLHVFDAQGNSLLTFDTPSTRLGPFRAPSGVALGPNGEIYVADTLNHRLFRLAWE